MLKKAPSLLQNGLLSSYEEQYKAFDGNTLPSINPLVGPYIV